MESRTRETRLGRTQPAPAQREHPALMVGLLGPARRDRRVLVLPVRVGADPRLARESGARLEHRVLRRKDERLDGALESAPAGEPPERGARVDAARGLEA